MGEKVGARKHLMCKRFLPQDRAINDTELVCVLHEQELIVSVRTQGKPGIATVLVGVPLGTQAYPSVPPPRLFPGDSAKCPCSSIGMYDGEFNNRYYSRGVGKG